MRWEHLVSKYEVNYFPDAKVYKYRAFGVERYSPAFRHGQGRTESEAIENMLRGVINEKPLRCGEETPS